MDIAQLSIVISQSRMQVSSDIKVLKNAMDAGKENTPQITEMMKNGTVYSNAVYQLNVWV